MKKITLILSTLCVLSLTQSSCKKKGCTDENATNYDSNAKKDDGSCVLPVINNEIGNDQSYKLKANIDGIETTYSNIWSFLNGDRSSISGTANDFQLSVKFHESIPIGSHDFTNATDSPEIAFTDENNQLYWSDRSLPGSIEVIELDSIDTSNRFIKGTFSCTLKHQNNGTTKSISGEFQGPHRTW